MTLFQAAILGLVQGLGEFLPISSSAHLVLVPWLFGWADPGLTFDVALHLGTLAAVVLYFWRDWWRLTVEGFRDFRSPQGRLFWYLAAASAPGALGGYLLEEKAETILRSPLLIAAMLILLGLLLHWADRRSPKTVEMSRISLGQSLCIGVSQALAVIPGVSRSGVTITTALFLGLSREGAARFSFLLSMPIVFGAAAVKMPAVVSNPSMITPGFLLGVLVSAAVGLLSIGFLLRYVQTRDFLPFVWYRFLLGGLVVMVFLAR